MYEDPNSFKKPVQRKRQRVRETEDGTLVAKIKDLDSWQVCFDRQANLEKLRLYFCVIAWQIMAKVHPNHKIFKKFEDIMNSPDYLRDKLNSDFELEALSLSLSSMGKIPRYNILGINMGEIIGTDIKIEPIDD